VNKIKQRLIDNDIELSGLALNVSQKCNLRCRYCFASGDPIPEFGCQGTYGDESLMSLNVGISSVDFLFSFPNNTDELKLIYFGGEPLLNFEIVKKITEYGKDKAQEQGKKITFEIDTNGTILSKEILDFIDDYNVNIQLSIDGKKNIHDKCRYFENGEGSHDIVIHNLNRILTLNLNNLSVRFVISKYNTNLYDTILYIKSLGVKNIDFDPVITKETEYGLNNNDLKKVLKSLKKYTDVFQQKALDGKVLNSGKFLDSFKLIDEQRKYQAKNYYFCGAGRRLYGVSSKGEIYPCASFVGVKEYKLGDIYSGININRNIKFIKNNNVDNKIGCSQCFAKYLCGGGCAHESIIINKDIHIPNDTSCFFRKDRWKSALKTYNKIIKSDPELINILFNYKEYEEYTLKIKNIMNQKNKKGEIT
jgi:uncharacterized protein